MRVEPTTKRFLSFAKRETPDAKIGDDQVTDAQIQSQESPNPDPPQSNVESDVESSTEESLVLKDAERTVLESGKKVRDKPKQGLLSKLAEQSSPIVSPTEEIQIIITPEMEKKAYDARMLPSGKYGKAGKYFSKTGQNEVLEARSRAYTYTWFRGPNGEEVKMNSKGEKFFRVTNANGSKGAVSDLHQPEKFISDPNLKFTVSGETLDDPRNKPQKFPDGKDNQHGMKGMHPAYSQFRDRIKKARVLADMEFDITKMYFRHIPEADAQKYVQSVWHEYIPEIADLYDNSDNLAMLYAIKNSLIRNLFKEGVGQIFSFSSDNSKDMKAIYKDKSYDIIVETLDLSDTKNLLESYNIYDNRQTTDEIDQREEALARSIAEVAKIDPLRPDISLNPVQYGDVELPSVLKSIEFRDENLATPEADNGVLPESNIVYTLEVYTATRQKAASFQMGMGYKRMKTKVKIPKSLIVKANIKIEDIADDINLLYEQYSTSFRAALDRVKIQRPPINQRAGF